jgi:hypothetical protein
MHGSEQEVLMDNDMVTLAEDIRATEALIRRAEDGQMATLELCQVYVALRDGLPGIGNAIHMRTGFPPEEFLNGMRRLLAPAEEL